MIATRSSRVVSARHPRRMLSDELARQCLRRFPVRDAIQRRLKSANNNSGKRTESPRSIICWEWYFRQPDRTTRPNRLWSEPFIWTPSTKSHSSHWHCSRDAEAMSRLRIVLNSGLSAPMIGDSGHDRTYRTIGKTVDRFNWAACYWSQRSAVLTRTLLQNRRTSPSQARTFFNREPPPQYLEEWVQRLAQPEEHVEQDLLSLVIFRLHDEYLAVQTRWLVEVTLPQPIHAIPHRTNEVVLGLVNIRGQLRICFSAHGLLGVALSGGKRTDPSQRGLACGDRPQRHCSECSSCTSGRSSGFFLSRRCWESTVCPCMDLRPVPSTFGKAGAFSQSVFTWEGHTVGYLDETRFLSALRSACK